MQPAKGFNIASKTGGKGVAEKVLYISYSLDIGGLEVFLLELSKGLDRRKFSPVVCSLSPGGELRTEFARHDIPVHDVPKKSGVDLSVAWRLARLCRANGIRIIHTHNYSTWLYGVLSRLFGSGVRVVHTEHSCVDKTKYRRLLAERALSYGTNSLVAVSEAVGGFLRDRVKVGCRDFAVIPNGVDLNHFQRPVDILKKRRSLNIPPGHSVIGIVARLAPVKNHKMLLSAFAVVAQKSSDTTLMIVGDGELRAELEGFSKGLGISNVLFLGARRDIAELLRVMDVFVLCSKSEGHPVTLLEAMASGRAVVATSVGGVKEVVRHGQNGLLVEPEDVKGLAGAIASIIEAPEFAHFLGSNAMKDVVEKYSAKAMIKRYEEVYSRIL